LKLLKVKLKWLNNMHDCVDIHTLKKYSAKVTHGVVTPASANFRCKILALYELGNARELMHT